MENSMTKDTKPTTSHLPGPWTYNFDRPFGIVNIIAPDPTGKNPQGIYIAEIDCDDVGCLTSYEQHEANTRRIVAAINACEGIRTEALEQGIVRELLQALEEIYNWLTPDWQQSSLGNKARAAIAKASGRAA
jgi:hypothetical protein